MIQRLRKWLLFTVLIGLVPFLFVGFQALLDHRPLRLELFFAKGELLLLCCMLSATAFGDLLDTPKHLAVYRDFVGFFAAMVVLVAAWGFGECGTASGLSNPALVARWSIWMFIISVITGGSAVMLRDI